MIFCQARQGFVAKMILLAHMNYWEAPRLHVLLKGHALDFWMGNVTLLEPIAYAKRGLSVLPARVFTKRRNTMVCAYDVIQHASISFVFDYNLLT